MLFLALEGWGFFSLSSCERKAFPKGFKQFHKTNVKTKTLLFKDCRVCFGLREIERKGREK